MCQMNENIYVVGPEARGDSFFGRAKELRDLNSPFDSVANIHLVGPTRIGKSSLVTRVFEQNQNRPNRILVKMSMGESADAFDFWTTLVYNVKEQLDEKNIWDGRFEDYYNQILRVSSDSPDWFTVIKWPIQNMLKQIKKLGMRVVLAIDEYDSVVSVFGQCSHHFHLLRSIFTSPDYGTSAIIISRRRLHLLESNCQFLSSFHGIFREKPLRAFNDDDMEEFYASLAKYAISMSSGGKKKLEKITGRMPYLCCMFAERMISNGFTESSIGDKEVGAIFKECLPQIDQYYEDLIERLEYDDQLETVFYLSVTSKLPSSITKRDIENMKTMGVLNTEQNNNAIEYYVYSKDFMTYFSLRPLKLPAWETITQSEKKIKAIFKKEYPQLDEITYDILQSDRAAQIINRLNNSYPELNLIPGKIKRYCEDLAIHKDHPTVLDVLTLSEVVKIILETWNTRFHKYFMGDESWKPKLEFIKELRNPMAHAAIEYIAQDDLATCMRYCDEIIHLSC